MNGFEKKYKHINAHKILCYKPGLRSFHMDAEESRVKRMNEYNETLLNSFFQTGYRTSNSFLIGGRNIQQLAYISTRRHNLKILSIDLK